MQDKLHTQDIRRFIDESGYIRCPQCGDVGTRVSNVFWGRDSKAGRCEIELHCEHHGHAFVLDLRNRWGVSRFSVKKMQVVE